MKRHCSSTTLRSVGSSWRRAWTTRYVSSDGAAVGLFRTTSNKALLFATCRVSCHHWSPTSSYFSSMPKSFEFGSSSSPSSSKNAASSTVHSINAVPRRSFSGGGAPPPPSLDLTGHYHIEVSNLDAHDSGATRLTVTGPDVDGILASMTVALAVRGCSLVSLHAAKDEDGPLQRDHSTGGGTDGSVTNNIGICDIFYVVDRSTGQPFEDHQLHGLGLSLLEALRSPMVIMNGGGGGSALGVPIAAPSPHLEAELRAPPPYATQEEQITIVPSSPPSAN